MNDAVSPSLCRDCGAVGGDPGPRCAVCAGPRLVRHPELGALAVAHVDCDAFYASVEKRRRPELRDQPVIVGGGRRGVVAAACYVARSYGVRSAMPMFKALAACPRAVVIRPDMAEYARVGRAVRSLMLDLTPLVEPVSIDEAYLDLSGCDAVHGGPPAQALARMARTVEADLGITVSIGLAPNKLLAKIASDLDKPRGFAVVGRAEAAAFLAPRPVGVLPGVGAKAQAALARQGFRTLGQLQAADPRALVRVLGAWAAELPARARGEDDRPVDPRRPVKSVSAETTLDRDAADVERLARLLWPLAETVARRLKAAGLAATGVTLKLKTAELRALTRQAALPRPTQSADALWRGATALLRREPAGPAYRLIGLGTSGLAPGAAADPPDLVDPRAAKQRAIEDAMDALRAKLGPDAVMKGRGLAAKAARDEG